MELRIDGMQLNRYDDPKGPRGPVRGKRTLGGEVRNEVPNGMQSDDQRLHL